MNLHSLRYFIEVAKTKSFTQASKNLFISQPGISQQIRSLEKQLNFPLLHRTTREVELTEEGKYLYEKIITSFNDIEDTVSHLIEANTFPKLISIATVPTAASLYLPTILERLHDLYPKVELQIQETTSQRVMKLIDNRTCHFGFIRTTDNFHLEGKDLHYSELGKSPIKVVVSSKHKFAHRDKIKLEELRNEKFLHYNTSESSALYSQIEAACIHAGFKPNTICNGSEFLTMANIISHNLAVALMPHDMLQLVPNNNIIAIDLEDVFLESSIAGVWKDNGYINVNTKILLNAFRNLHGKTTTI